MANAAIAPLQADRLARERQAGKRSRLKVVVGDRTRFGDWEADLIQGGVENYNGLVRQYFPKGHDFRTITQERLQEVQEEINANMDSTVYLVAEDIPERAVGRKLVSEAKTLTV